MKITVSGGGGIGKTTLINHIKDELEQYVVIPDYIDTILCERGLKSPREMDDKLAREIRLEALERKINAENESTNFLSDKSVGDYYAYWQIWTMNIATESEKRKFYDLVKEHVDTYDKVIIPPFGRFKIEDNNIRNTNWYHQFRVHTLIKEIYNKMGVPYEEYSLDLNDAAEKIVGDLEIN